MVAFLSINLGYCRSDCNITTPKSTKYIESYYECAAHCYRDPSCQSVIYEPANVTCYTFNETVTVDSFVSKYFRFFYVLKLMSIKIRKQNGFKMERLKIKRPSYKNLKIMKPPRLQYGQGQGYKIFIAKCHLGFLFFLFLFFKDFLRN